MSSELLDIAGQGRMEELDGTGPLLRTAFLLVLVAVPLAFLGRKRIPNARLSLVLPYDLRLPMVTPQPQQGGNWTLLVV